MAALQLELQTAHDTNQQLMEVYAHNDRLQATNLTLTHTKTTLETRLTSADQQLATTRQELQTAQSQHSKADTKARQLQLQLNKVYESNA